MTSDLEKEKAVCIALGSTITRHSLTMKLFLRRELLVTIPGRSGDALLLTSLSVLYPGQHTSREL